MPNLPCSRRRADVHLSHLSQFVVRLGSLFAHQLTGKGPVLPLGTSDTMRGGTPEAMARHTPLTTVPEDSDEDGGSSPTGRESSRSPPQTNPGRLAPLVSPGARHDAAGRLSTPPPPSSPLPGGIPPHQPALAGGGPRGMQPPAFIKGGLHAGAPSGPRRAGAGAISPPAVRGGLGVPKFLEDQRGLGAVPPSEARSPAGPPQPPSFLRGSLGMPSPLKTEARPRSVEPPGFLQVCRQPSRSGPRGAGPV